MSDMFDPTQAPARDLNFYKNQTCRLRIHRIKRVSLEDSFDILEWWDGSKWVAVPIVEEILYAN